LKAGSSAKKMPRLSFTVQVRKSSEISGMPSATSGLMIGGRARWS
jgi:hypothetical protein